MTRSGVDRPSLAWVGWAILAVLGLVWLGYLLLTGRPGFIDAKACDSVFMAYSTSREIRRDIGELAFMRCNSFRIQRLGWSIPVTLLTAFFGGLAMMSRYRRYSVRHNGWLRWAHHGRLDDV